MFNAGVDWLSKDPDVEDVGKFLTPPQEVLRQEVEEQQNEIGQMLNGFGVPVGPNDKHAIHLDVIEQWTQTPEGAAAMKNEKVAGLIQQHANVHIQAEQQQTGAGGVQTQA